MPPSAPSTVIKSGKNQITAPNVASFKKYGVPTKSNNSVKEVLTPMANQVSMYDTVMTSASMPLQYIKESSHNSDPNHYNPMSIKEPLKKKPTLCPTSDQEPSSDLGDRTSASKNTSGETGPKNLG